ncbi:hypothetical protein B0H17DRAFT_1074837, partial [Mycena rosella]
MGSEPPYPVLTLPVELVDHIFAHCLPPLPIPGGGSSETLTWGWTSESLPQSTNKVPLLLSSICSTWRRIALSSPKLWTTLTMRFEAARPNAQVLRDRVSLCETWLARSRNLPLHLGLRYTHPDPPSLVDDAFLDVLNGCSFRWKSLRLRMQRCDFDRLCQRLGGRIPLLDTLCVDIVQGGRVLNLSEIIAFEDAPVLPNLLLATPFWFCLNGAKQLPVTRLKRLYVVQFAFAGLFLCIAPNLEECCAAGPFIHRGLRVLRAVHGKHHRPFLDCITTPALEKLELRLGADEEHHFLNFMARSSCPLRTFHLRFQKNSIMSADALSRCLAVASSLTELKIYLPDCDTSESLISAILSPESLSLLATLYINDARA